MNESRKTNVRTKGSGVERVRIGAAGQSKERKKIGAAVEALQQNDRCFGIPGIITYMGGGPSSSSSSSSSFLLLLNLPPMIYPSFAGEAGPGLQKKGRYGPLQYIVPSCSQAPGRRGQTKRIKGSKVQTSSVYRNHVPQFLVFCSFAQFITYKIILFWNRLACLCCGRFLRGSTGGSGR